MMVAIHSADFIRRRATGEAHIVPGSHAFRSSRFSTTKPKPRASPVATTKYGRNGSNVVARPAPLRPRATAMSGPAQQRDRKSTRLNSSHSQISYAVFCFKKKKKTPQEREQHTNDKHTGNTQQIHT